MKLAIIKTVLIIVAMMFTLNAGILKLTDQSNFIHVTAIPENNWFQFHTKIENISEKSVNLLVIKRRISLPSKWDVSMCLESCLPPFVDTLEYELAAGKEVSLDVDFLFENGASSGTGEVQFTIVNVDNKAEKYERVYGIHYASTAKTTESLGFSFESPGTVATVGKMTQLHGSVKSSRSETTSVILKRRSVQAPENWDITMCVNGLCLPPFIEETEFDIAPNGKVSLDIDVTPTDSGVAFLAFDLQDTQTAEQVSMLFAFPTYGSVSTPILGSQGTTLAPVALAIRGSIAQLTLPQSGPARITLLDFRGREIAELFNGIAHSGSALLLPMPDRASATYLISVEQNGRRMTVPFIYSE